MKIAELIREWLPPTVYRAIGRWSGRSLRFTGGWSDWADAAAASTGYDDASILKRVVDATREVVAGHAAFERDSVTFKEWQPAFQLLAPMLRHALKHESRLDVVDFGGALGSTYRQSLPFFPPLDALRWQVIEQPDFVKAGQSEFEDESLFFFTKLADLPPPLAPRLLLASSVLQYLSEPDQILDEWERAGVTTIVLDRTPVWEGLAHQAVVQHVPPHIYPASYPCWLLSRTALLARMSTRWRLICETDCPEGRHFARNGPNFEFRSFVWERVA
jgi:putative methyltransferase (TIGR04325 family)